MRIEQRDRLVAGIYDAALGARPWDDVLLNLAAALGCRQSGLEIHDPRAGVVERRAPLCAPEDQASYRAYWGRQVSLYRKTDRFPVGRVFQSAEIFDMDVYRRSAFYNEWWRPQGTGGEALLANVAADSRATAVLAAYKPFAKPHFTAEERGLFDLAVQHFMRAIDIHRRLHLAKVRLSPVGGDPAPEGFVLVDRHGRVLTADPEAHRRLAEADAFAESSQGDCIDLSDSSLARLVAGAVGEVVRRGRDGSLVRISAAPLSRPGGEDWLSIDRPAIVLHIGRPEEAKRTRISQLVAVYGLTPAEAAVAYEAARGDGRAAIAARLGIRETTVRTHLSVIFQKTGVRRQAELVSLLARS